MTTTILIPFDFFIILIPRSPNSPVWSWAPNLGQLRRKKWGPSTCLRPLLRGGHGLCRGGRGVARWDRILSSGCPGRVGAMKAVNYKPQKVDHCQPYSPDRRFPDKFSPAALIPRSPILHSLFPVPHSPIPHSPVFRFPIPHSPFPDSLFPIPRFPPILLFFCSPFPKNFRLRRRFPVPRFPIPFIYDLDSPS